MDIGAFESQGFTITVNSGNNQSAIVGASFAQPLTVTVTANDPLEPVNGGVVTFEAPTSGASATLSPSSAIISNGSASTTATANSTAGSYTVTATASGISTPANFSLTNTPAATSTSDVSLSVTSAVYGQPVTLMATVTNTQTSASPSGIVTFYKGTTALGTAAVGTDGSATLTISTLGVGTHSLKASFSDPDGNFDPSSSAKHVSLKITQASTTTSLTTDTNSAVYGQPVTFTANVAAVAPSGATPDGSVTFTYGSTTLATVALSGGVASYTTSKLVPGTYIVTATYNGNAKFGTSASSTETVTVSQDATTAVVTSSVSSPVFGQSVTLKATVTASAPGSGAPTGSVTFYDGTVSLGSATLDGSGVATLKTTALPVGSNSITVVYSGDSNFQNSTSAALAITVVQDGTKTQLTSSSSTASAGQSVTFTATVLPSSPGSGTPTGTVTFWNGSVELGTANLSNGVAAFSYVFALPAKYKIHAVYNGDPDFVSSTSSVLTETIS